MSSRTGATVIDLLPELYVDNFDNEQIFQQLELYNNHVFKEHRRAAKAMKASSCSVSGKVKSSSLVTQLSKRVTDESHSPKKRVMFESDAGVDAREEIETDSNADSEEDSALQTLIDSVTNKKTAVQYDDVDDNFENDNDDDSDDDGDKKSSSDSSGSDSDEDNARTASLNRRRTLPKKKTNRVSAVDDRFFKLSEMEDFLNEQDLKEERQHCSNADDSEDDDDYDSAADDEVIGFCC